MFCLVLILCRWANHHRVSVKWGFARSIILHHSFDLTLWTKVEFFTIMVVLLGKDAWVLVQTRPIGLGLNWAKHNPVCSLVQKWDDQKRWFHSERKFEKNRKLNYALLCHSHSERRGICLLGDWGLNLDTHAWSFLISHLKLWNLAFDAWLEKKLGVVLRIPQELYLRWG